MNELPNKRVFITGGASGISGATVRLLLQEGARVCSMSRSDAWPDDIRQQASFLSVKGDVRNEADVQAAFAQCLAAFGGVDVLINNAGVGIPTPDIATAGLAAYEQMMDTNMKGLFLCSREAIKIMKENGSGHVINLVSMAGQRTNANAPLYCASKFGARGLSSGLADQVVKLGIKVTDVNPGPVDSDYWGDRKVPREKFLKVEDVARVILFILNQPGYMLIREMNFDNMNFLAG